MSATIKIKPYTKTSTQCVLSTSVSLYNNCIVNCRLFTDAGEVLFNQNVVLTDDEYSQWGQNDNYIRDLVFSKLGLEYDPTIIQSQPETTNE